jgi:type VI protein secretion system component VasK
MSTSHPDRARSTMYLLAGALLLIVQCMRFPQFYAEWAANSLDSTRLIISLIGFVAALFMLRTGWRLRRTSRQNDVID